MDKQLFKLIQNNFKQFLMEKKNPSIKIKEEIIPSIKTHKVIELEKTTAFGREDNSIGYKILSTNNKGIQKTKITTTPPTTST